MFYFCVGKFGIFMNPITYQPTGVYKQFVQNPGLLASSGQNNNASVSAEAENAPAQKKKISPALKTAVAIGVLVTAALVFPKAKHLKDEYKKGTEWLKKRKAMPEEIVDQDTFDEFMKKHPKDTELKKDFLEIMENAEKYENNWVGKLQRRIKAIKDFFQYNFYNY